MKIDPPRTLLREAVLAFLAKQSAAPLEEIAAMNHLPFPFTADDARAALDALISAGEVIIQNSTFKITPAGLARYERNSSLIYA